MIEKGEWLENEINVGNKAIRLNVNNILHWLVKNGQKGLNGKPTTSLLNFYNRKLEYYNGITIAFRQLNLRHPEFVALYIYIESHRISWLSREMLDYPVFAEDLMLRRLSPAFRELNDSYINDNKVASHISKVDCQKTDSTLCRRSGLLYDCETDAFILKLSLVLPTGGGSTILGKPTSRFIRDIVKLTDEKTAFGDKKEAEKRFSVYKKQQQIRTWCRDNDCVAFIADGSILPRIGDTDEPDINAVPFRSPEKLRVTIPFDDGSEITGMALKQGVTVITGAGFSGKTTLLEAIDAGVYDRIPGDGREYVISDRMTLITNAEDGRFIGNTDMSVFFRKIPGHDCRNFTTNDASGSVSQAANIIEAVQAGAKLLLIDEDKSATNFMICDRKMRRLVPDEIIIPFTDRIGELVRLQKLSCIIVIGGSGEYFRYADNIIVMRDYLPQLVDDAELEAFRDEKQEPDGLAPAYIREKYLNFSDKDVTKFLFRIVKAEKIKKVIVGEFSADVSALSEIKEDNQLHGLAVGVFGTMVLSQTKKEDLITLVRDSFELYWDKFIGESYVYGGTTFREWFVSEVRPMDIIMTINRMRGFDFSGKADNT